MLQNTAKVFSRKAHVGRNVVFEGRIWKVSDCGFGNEDYKFKQNRTAETFN